MDFRFSLQQVLDVKENQKNEVEVEYNEAYRSFEMIAEKLYFVLQRQETIVEQNNQKLEGGTSIFDIQSFQKSVTALQNKIDEYQEMFQQARRVVEEKKDHLLDKSIDVKKYEKLKDIQFEQFRKKHKHAEMKMFDEVSTVRFFNE
jgi:flagellar FliJ protein